MFVAAKPLFYTGRIGHSENNTDGLMVSDAGIREGVGYQLNRFGFFVGLLFFLVFLQFFLPEFFEGLVVDLVLVFAKSGKLTAAPGGRGEGAARTARGARGPWGVRLGRAVAFDA